MKILLLLAFFLSGVVPVQAGETPKFSVLLDAVTKETTSPYAIESLIIGGENVNAADEQGRTVLMLAAMYHPSPLVPYLLVQNGADVNARTPDTGQTALFFAAKYNSNPEVVSGLLNYGADQNIKDVFGKNAHHYALRNPALKKSPVLWLFHDHHEEPADSSSKSAASR